MQQLIEEGLAASADTEDVLVPVSAIRMVLFWLVRVGSWAVWVYDLTQCKI
jgi:hypothetical protein